MAVHALQLSTAAKVCLKNKTTNTQPNRCHPVARTSAICPSAMAACSALGGGGGGGGATAAAALTPARNALPSPTRAPASCCSARRAPRAKPCPAFTSSPSAAAAAPCGSAADGPRPPRPLPSGSQARKGGASRESLRLKVYFYPERKDTLLKWPPALRRWPPSSRRCYAQLSAGAAHRA